MTSEKQIAANQRNALKSTGPTTPAGKQAVRHNALKHGLLAKDVVITTSDGQESIEEFDQLLGRLHEDLQPEGVLEDMLVEKIAIASWRLRRAQRAEMGEIRKALDSAMARVLASREETFDRVREALDPQRTALAGLTSSFGDDKTHWARRNLHKTSLGLQYLIDVVDEIRREVEETSVLSWDADQRLVRLFGVEDEGLVSRIRALFPDAGDEEEEEEEAEELSETPLSPDAKQAVLDLLDGEVSQLAGRKQRIDHEEEMELEVLRASLSLPGDQVGQRILRHESMYERQLYKAIDQLERLQRQRRGEVVPPPINVALSTED